MICLKSCAVGLVFILTGALALYGRVSFNIYDKALVTKLLDTVVDEKSSENNIPKVKNTNELFTVLGWQKFAEGFFGGGLIGCVVAAILISIYATYF